MNIAISARTLKEEPGDGIAWFTFEVIKRMVRDNPGEKFYLISDRHYKNLPVNAPNVEYLYLWPPNRHPLIWYFWHQIMLRPVLKKIKADIFIAPDGIMPLRCKIPCIPVIHDLNHFHRPSDIPFIIRTFYRYFFPIYAARAARVATVSDFSANDISITYGIKRDRIDVIYNGVSEVFSPLSSDESEAFRGEMTDSKPYFLFVSNLSPRKNVVTLIKAFDLFRQQTGLNHNLILTGSRLFLNKEIDKAIRVSPYKDSIVFTGNAGRDRLRLLYGSATAFVFVPWFEGFGIPVIEAMRCGVPCLLSDNSSLPEIGGGAGLYVSAADTEAIAAAMARLAGEPALRRHLSDEGLKNSLKYSWDKTAAEMWNCVTKIVTGNA
jgi:glycosyltransferase involved in cell wall biosynthesis